MLINSEQVALIDDGVDVNHPDLGGRKFAGKSFDDYDDKVTPYWESTTGHGTLMARLIIRMCPSASIYVIKSKAVGGNHRGKTPLDAESCVDVSEKNMIDSPQYPLT